MNPFFAKKSNAQVGSSAFQEEKDKIVQILEAGFSQREKLSLQKCEEDLAAKFEFQLEETRQHWEEEKLKCLENLKKEHAVKLESEVARSEHMQKLNCQQTVQKACTAVLLS